MKKTLFTFTIALMALMLTGQVLADSIHVTTADTSIALRFKNTGTELATINIDAGDSATNNVTIGSTVTTLDFSGAGADTIVEISALIAAAKNSAGIPVLIADARCALGTDSTDDELLDTQAIAIAAKVGSKESWGEILWDTSVHLSYDVYIPAANQAPSGTRTSIDLAQLYGNPIGTGAGLASIYLDGTLAWQVALPEVFAYSNNTATVAIPIDVDIPAITESVLVRVARATTATTGMVGVRAVPTDQK